MSKNAKAVLDALEKLASQRISASELVQGVVGRLGGVQGVAQMIANEIQLAEDGSPLKQQMMKLLAEWVTEEDKRQGDKRDVAALPDEELQRFVDALIEARVSGSKDVDRPKLAELDWDDDGTDGTGRVAGADRAAGADPAGAVERPGPGGLGVGDPAGGGPACA